MGETETSVIVSTIKVKLKNNPLRLLEPVVNERVRSYGEGVTNVSTYLMSRHNPAKIFTRCFSDFMNSGNYLTPAREMGCVIFLIKRNFGRNYSSILGAKWKEKALQRSTCL